MTATATTMTVRALRLHTAEPSGWAKKLRGAIGGAEKKLSNEKFLANADPDVVEAEKSRHAELGLELENIERNLSGF